MSHSQFHCTGRAYLDMHGLIFETSICYWQDQPGRRARGAGRPRHRGAFSGRGPDAGGSERERTSVSAEPRATAGERRGGARRGTNPGPAADRFPAAARRTDRPAPADEGAAHAATPWRGARGASPAGGGPDGGRERRATWHPGRRVESRDTRTHGRGASRARARGPLPGAARGRRSRRLAGTRSALGRALPNGAARRETDPRAPTRNDAATAGGGGHRAGRRPAPGGDTRARPP